MAQKSGYPKGVIIRRESIQINIRINGKRKYITLPQKATPKAISEAGKLRAHLIHLEKWGALTQKDIDEACNIKTESIEDNRPTFFNYAQIYLDNINSDNPRTRAKYKGILKNRWMPYFAPTAVADITPAMIRNAINEQVFGKPRTYNDALIPLRGVFDLAFLDEVIEDNPTKRLRNKKVQVEEPDPLLPAERQKILEHMEANWKGKKEVWYLFYKWQLWTGCRPSETLAINWSDIDWDHETVKISKTLSDGKVKLSTKTHHIRNVHLNEMAKEVLLRLMQLTKHQDRLFISLHTGEPWTRDEKLSEKFKPLLVELGIRERPAYNCRHTYATTMLNSMIEIGACAYQLGHDIQTFKTTYAKWLNTEKMKSEMMKLDYD